MRALSIWNYFSFFHLFKFLHSFLYSQLIISHYNGLIFNLFFLLLLFLLDLKGMCRNCRAFKKVNLSVDGYCQKCRNLRECPICNTRRPSKFFRSDLPHCITCDRKMKNPNVKVSVLNCFAEEDIPINCNATDVESLIQQHHNYISNTLERVLSDEGYDCYINSYQWKCNRYTGHYSILYYSHVYSKYICK